MEGLVERLERAVTRLEKMSITMQVSNSMANGDCTNGIDGGLSRCMEAFDVLLRGPVSEYMNYSRAIGSVVEKHADMVNTALQTQRTFLKMVATHRQPAQMELKDLLKPISDHIHEIQSFRERNRGSNLFNHLSAVSESIPALGWVAVCQKPGPYVKELNDSAIFYTNRVLKDYKETDQRHVDWVRSYLGIWTVMQSFIKEHHTTGLEWCMSGPIAPPSIFELPSTPSCPPPTSPLLPPAHLRSSLMTPSLRRAPPHTQHCLPSSTKATVQKRPPLMMLDGKKWRVENFEQKHDLVIEERRSLKQVVYVFGCNNSTLQIKGKINSIIIDNCKKLGLVLRTWLDCGDHQLKSIQIQVLGKVPTISINTTEGCQVYLSKDSLNCDIVSAKSSEMNILVPQDDDYREFPVPEQFKTVWNGCRLVTEPTEMAG
ncbi:hypothetical protein KUCAC02_011644 [Chaenocephalus aceratus]|uniref:Uncharacterized protein n=1 Tax=Chaenocephalus aceratus TaxID=36190 RepID=A0ACB9WX04_CHAAC|nr:hypothetical protein KUCAC02_011644 [Chaenocephalus aceratus]